MPNTTTSPNMGMPVPVPSVDPGPDWANNIVACLSIVDSHNHVSGAGAPVPTAGININADLPFGGNNAINLRSARFASQAVPLAGAADLECVYVSGVDLYYNDGSGNKIRMTQSGAVTGATGTITGLPSGTASASFAGGTFTFQSATNTPANMAVGPLIIGQNVANSKTVTLTPNAGQASNFTLTLPAALAGTTGSVLVSDTSGNMSWVTTLAANLTFSGALTLSGASTLTGTISGGNYINPQFLGTSVANGTFVAVGGPQGQGHILVEGGGVASNAPGDLLFYDGNDVNFIRVRSAALGTGAGTPTYSLPDFAGNDTFALLAAAQTFTNKTFNAGTFSGTITLSGTIAGGNYTSPSETGGTYTNPTLAGTISATNTVSIAAGANNSLLLRGNGLGVQGDILFYDGNNTNSIVVRNAATGTGAGNPVYSLPDFAASDTFALLAANQALTKKTLSTPTFAGSPTVNTHQVTVFNDTATNIALAIYGNTSNNRQFAIYSSTIGANSGDSLRMQASGAGSATIITGVGFNGTTGTDLGIFPFGTLRFSNDQGSTINGSVSNGAWSLGTITGQDVQHMITNSSTSFHTAVIQNRNASQPLTLATLEISAGNAGQPAGVPIVEFFCSDGATDSGSIQIRNNGAAPFFAAPVSDRRLKTNIRSIDGALGRIMALKPSIFDFIDGHAHDTVGLIAQDLQDVFPDDVLRKADGFLTIGGWSPQLVYIVAAIQEQQRQINQLVAKCS